jgi:hypothetical protein
MEEESHLIRNILQCLCKGVGGLPHTPIAWAGDAGVPNARAR